MTTTTWLIIAVMIVKWALLGWLGYLICRAGPE